MGGFGTTKLGALGNLNNIKKNPLEIGN